MPIFDYHCKICKITEERTVKKYDDIQYCQCGAEMIKQLSSPCFILHGVGITSNGSFKKAKEGPKLDKDLLMLSDAELNYECGLPPDCE